MPDDKSYSNIFLQYAEVLRQATQEEQSPQKLETLLTLPATIWNSVTLDEIKGTNHTQGILDYMASLPTPQKESGKKMVNYWIERKKTKFSQHKWSVEHSVGVRNGQLMIRVQACDISEIVQN